MNQKSNYRFAQALAVGLVFGFLLQKGGVAKLHLLIGALLLEDFTVLRVMLSAILVGMFGTMLLRRLGKIEYAIKPPRWTANTVGGLVFGVGFACSGYCPGTGAAALGQLNGDALFMVAGMLAGSYAYALASGPIEAKLEGRSGGSRPQRLPELIGVKPLPFAFALAGLLVIVLWMLRLR